jgi:hypothetical protein
MITTLLERKVPQLEPPNFATSGLLDYAKQNLGYVHPEKERLSREGELATALRVAGITPFTRKSVMEYKEARRLECDQRNVNFLHARRKAGKAFLICLLLGVALGLFLVPWSGYGAKLTTSKSIMFVFLGVVAAGTLMSAFLYAVFDENIKHLRIEWKQFALTNYSQPIPEFALTTAKEIHQRVPGVQFFIDELVVENLSKDPFLVAKLGDLESYHVEVWAEPGYQQKRMV